MNKYKVYLLKALKRAYASVFSVHNIKPQCEQNPENASQIIYEALTSSHPAMIARFGSTEMTCLVNYVAIKNHMVDYFGYIQGKSSPWWWEQGILNQMQIWSGFFPPTQEKISEFSELMLNDIPEVDVLGSWLPQEKQFDALLANCKKVDLELLNPYFTSEPWTKALKHKKVLVVHPFAQTIKEQYKKRSLLFSNDLLPEFELYTIKAVQSIAGESTSHRDWFAALNYMKSEIDKIDFDICLIGCGAYGFPLAAHVKRLGKKAVHLGGGLQLLFGIRGKRWENENYNPTYNYAKLINEHWVKPGADEKPQNASVVEGACYW